MAGNGKGIDWMIDLDARTQGALDVIQALGKTRSAAEAAGLAIDRALSKMDKLESFENLKKSRAAENAAWSSAIRNAKDRIAAGEQESRMIKSRTAMVSLEAHEMGKHAEALKKEQSMAAEVMKGEMMFEALREGARLAYEAVERVVDGMIDVVRTAAGAERLGRVFDNMLGKDEASETLEYLDKFAGMSEFTDDALKGVANSFLRANMRGADFRNAMAAAIDVAAEAPDKLEGLQEASASLSRMYLTGRVDARTLYGLRLDPHKVTEQISKDLGIAKDTIAKKLKEGTLTGAEAMDSIFTQLEKKTGKQLGAAGDAMKDTMVARWEKLADVPEEMFKGIRNSQGYQDISDTIAKVFKLVGPDSAAGERIEAALGKTFDKVGELIKGIDWDHVVDVVVRLVEATEAWVEPLGKVVWALGKIAELLSALSALPMLGRDLGDYAARQTNADLGGGKVKSAGMLARAAAFVPGGGALAAFGSMFESNGDFFDNAKNDAIARISSQNEKAWKELGASQALAEQEGYKEANEIHSPSRVWMRLAEQSIAGLAIGFERSSGMASDAAASSIPAPVIGGGSGSSIGPGFHAGGITVQVNVNIGGSSGSPSEVGKEAADQTVSALIPVLEQFAVQAGLA